MKLYNIHKNPIEFLFKVIWGLPDDVYNEYISESCSIHRNWDMQRIRKTYQRTININRVLIMDSYRKFYEPKSMKIIINKNIGSRAIYNTHSFTKRIDICLHDKSRLKSNTTFTFYIRKNPQAEIAMKVSSSNRSKFFWRISKESDEMFNVIKSLAQSPKKDKSLLVFNSKPHTPGKGKSRLHKSVYHQKIEPEVDKKIKGILFILLESFLYEDLLDEFCQCHFSGISSVYGTYKNYYIWPLNRYPVTLLSTHYTDKKNGIELYNYYTPKPIINNYLIQQQIT